MHDADNLEGARTKYRPLRLKRRIWNGFSRGREDTEPAKWAGT
jgi:hypothetical protein